MADGRTEAIIQAAVSLTLRGLHDEVIISCLMSDGFSIRQAKTILLWAKRKG